MIHAYTLSLFYPRDLMTNPSLTGEELFRLKSTILYKAKVYAPLADSGITSHKNRHE